MLKAILINFSSRPTSLKFTSRKKTSTILPEDNQLKYVIARRWDFVRNYGFLAIIAFIFGLLALLFVIPTTVRADCSPVLSKPMLSAMKGPMKGTTNLMWNPVTGANRYALVFGLMPGNYMFGSLAIDGGMQTNYTVTHLTPGTTYYYQVWAFCGDDQPATPSNEAWFKAT